MDVKRYEILLNEVKSHIFCDLYALKNYYVFSKKMNSFVNVLINDIFPEFSSCIDDFRIYLYNYKIQKKHKQNITIAKLSENIYLESLSKVFDNLSWSLNSGIKKNFSKEKFINSDFCVSVTILAAGWAANATFFSTGLLSLE